MHEIADLDWSRLHGSQPKPPPVNPSYPSLRPTPSSQPSGRTTPMSSQASARLSSKKASTKPSYDSFSNLVNFGSAKEAKNLTLSERQTQLEAERRSKEEARRKQSEAQFGSAQQWDALGSRSFTASPASQAPPPSNGVSNDGDLFAAFNKDTKVDQASHYPPPTPHLSPPANDCHVELGNPSAWNTVDSANSALLWADDDPFGLSDVKPSVAPQVDINGSDALEDFLGDLGRPVDEVRIKRQELARPEPGKPIEDDESSSSDDSRRPRPRERSRKPDSGNDAFDQALAQLMDYGFSLDDARRGLLQSGSGANAEAVANWLLDDSHRKAEKNSQRESPSTQEHADPRLEAARAEADFTKSSAAMGSSFFKTANSLWNKGQKKVKRAVANFQQEREPGQPKWMRDAQQGRVQGSSGAGLAQVIDEVLALESRGRGRPARTGSRQPMDAKIAPESGRGPPSIPSSGSQSRSNSASRWQPKQQPTPPTMSDAQSRLNRLAAYDDSFSSHVSASRRRKPAVPAKANKLDSKPDLLFRSEASKSPRPSPGGPTPRNATSFAKLPQAPPMRNTPRTQRQIPPIDPATLQASTRHRLEGTAHFKRGDYAMAHSSYSSSMSAVPSTHPLMIVLLTNRALTALKTGEPKLAVADADEALKLIGPGNGLGETVPVQGESGQAEKRDMRELHGKALCRKAEALEQMEKWADAGSVWQLCVEAAAGGPTAIKGRQRCQDALTPNSKALVKPTARPRPKKSVVASLAPPKSSEAVVRLREANQAAAREDDEKFALSENVDARVSAWRDGKRDNLRALLGSMDKVLWENSGWKSVGLHELVMANKVKVSYMKAIAKTHPDKVGSQAAAEPGAERTLTAKQLPQDASTEVRLIAGLVFSTLNESWDKFKADNGL